MTSRGMGGSFGSNPRQPHRRQQLSCNSLAAPSERGPQRNCPSPQYCLSPYYAPQSRKTPATGSHQRRGVWGGGGTSGWRNGGWYDDGAHCSAVALHRGITDTGMHVWPCGAVTAARSPHPTHPHIPHIPQVGVQGSASNWAAPQITAAWPLGHAGTGNAGS